MKLADSPLYDRSGECDCVVFAYPLNLPHAVCSEELRLLSAAGLFGGSIALRVQSCPWLVSGQESHKHRSVSPTVFFQRKYWHSLCNRFDILFSEEMLSLVLFTLWTTNPHKLWWYSRQPFTHLIKDDFLAFFNYPQIIFSHCNILVLYHIYSRNMTTTCF